jgi:hypothetical protein
MIRNFQYDKLLDFGDSSAAGAFPNVLALKSLEADNAGRTEVDGFAVDFRVLADVSLTASTTAALTVQGANAASDTALTSPADLASVSGLAAAALKAGATFRVYIPKNNYAFIGVKVTNMTAGKINAVLSTEIGK